MSKKNQHVILSGKDWALRGEERVKDVRKPLIIRDARQVGKTTVVRQFSGEFQ